MLINNFRSSYIVFNETREFIPSPHTKHYLEMLSQDLNGDTNLPFSFPWGAKLDSTFWADYLESPKSPINFRTAKRFIIPLRFKKSFKFDDTSKIEFYLYPHGYTYIINCYLKNVLLRDLVTSVQDFNTKLECIEKTSQEWFSQHINWPEIFKNNIKRQRYIISTFTDIPLHCNIEFNSPELDNLFFQSGKQRNNSIEYLSPLKCNTPVNCTILYNNNSFVVLFPKYYHDTSTYRRSTTLSRYHRNISHGTMHTQSLLHLINSFCYKRAKANDNYVNQQAIGFIKSTQGILGRIYGKKSKCYHSICLKRQIDDLKEQVNTTRTAFSSPPLKEDKVTLNRSL